jgi:tRNA CCA-adding enzyme
MANKYSKVLEEVLEKVKVPESNEKIIEEELEKFLGKIEKKISKTNYKTKIFVGGSYAKKTLIEKPIYDVDVYLRFDKKYPDSNLTKMAKRILRGVRGVSVVHGSRDYFKVKINNWLTFEVIPVREISKAKEFENITDLSYSHVNYVRRKMKSEKVLEGIKLAKAFTHAKRVYGAESYVQGFSGYSLELLVYYFGGFIEFLKGMTKKTKEKMVIDIEKDYKNKSDVLLNMNGSRLEAPVVLVDPTFRRRNALAGLNEEKFLEFQKVAKEFLKNPRVEDFEIKKINYQKIKEILTRGPLVHDEKNVIKFEEKNGKGFVLEGRICVKKKFQFNSKEFLSVWSKLRRKKIKEMYISSFKILD